MRYKQGNLVEVLRRKYKPCSSWFPASVISAHGNYYNFRYKMLLDHEGQPAMEKVHKEDVRPWPPCKKRKRWMLGDVAEVFDIQCWRVGKIAKVLKDDIFVMRLFGSIQLKEFRVSNVRIPQAWHDNKWSVIGKVAQNKEFTEKCTHNKSEHSVSFVQRAPGQLMIKDSCLREKRGQKHLKDGINNVEMRLPARMINRSHDHHLERSHQDLVSCVKGCRRPLTSDLYLLKQADNISSPKIRVDEKFKGSSEKNTSVVKATTEWLCNSSRPLWTEDSSNPSSVASCTSNGFADSTTDTFRKTLGNKSDNSDAESSFLSLSVIKHLTPYFDQKLKAEIHELEFHAYRSTVQALYASGPLSWEQESLLTNLRLSLHISDEEHLLQLRHLLSTQVL